MTENKRFIVNDRWIKDNCIGALLNIDFNTITDANLCCGLLNQIEKEKRNNGKLASKLLEENEQLKQENRVFEGKDAKHYQRWVKQIKKYVEETNTDFTYDDDFIIKIALSYTLQSLRNGVSLKRFQWMTEKRFVLEDEVIIDNNSIADDGGRQLYWTVEYVQRQKLVDLMNTLAEENEQLKSENDSYKNMFFEIVETALTDTNCRELYCKGILDIFDKANSLNQAREMIKEHLK